MPEEPLTGRKLSFSRKLAYAAVVVLFSLTALFAIGEVGLRLSGRRPFARERADIRVETGGRLFESDPVLGYRQIAGSFDIILGGEYKFHATNLEGGFRATHAGPADRSRPEVWVLGDSITYGWSVNDEDTYAWRLQQQFPTYEFVNFGVNGYGTIHSLLQIREALAAGRKPAFVIITYASFHDERNTLTRSRRRALVSWEGLGPLNQPYGKIGSNGQLGILNGNAVFSELPLERYSSVVTLLSTRYDAVENSLSGSHAVSKAIIRETAALLNSQNIPFAIATLTSDAPSDDMRQFCESNGIRTIDAYVNYSQPGMNNLPYDGHPNATAHAIYAEKLADALRSMLAQ